MTAALRLLALASASLLSWSAHAAPMGFKESWMVMGDLSPNWREGFANYAFTAKDAVGPSLLYMRSDDKTKTRELAEVAYTRLLKRWNLPHAQANVWFVGGVGALRGNDFSGSRTMATPGLEIKAGVVPRAADRGSHDEPLGERSAVVRAGGAECMHLAGGPDEDDGLLADAAEQRHAFLDVSLGDASLKIRPG